MNIRKELLQNLYDLVINENLCENLQNEFNKVEELCGRNFPEEKEDEYLSALCDLEHAAFMAGANLVLDFISGKEVK